MVERLSHGVTNTAVMHYVAGCIRECGKTQSVGDRNVMVYRLKAAFVFVWYSHALSV